MVNPLSWKTRVPMAQRYFFVVEGPDRRYPDRIGTRLANKELALDYARRVLQELKQGRAEEFKDCSMLVQDELGNTLFYIPF